ncbi:hypothetical protein [Dactylosporangium sp. NPDC000521]|uniref:hypothetical protein n=1 Tax=Dactylosporangium sp. NPDC000521 TaxID=3363975 RepID=UPI0036A9AA44
MNRGFLKHAVLRRDRGFSVLKKAAMGFGSAVAAVALGAVIYLAAAHQTPAADAGVVSRPASRSELQPPPKPELLKPSERVVVTSK